jgi:glyoxylase I family protein
MIKRLAHICLMTRNLEETFKFYHDALGLEKRFDFIRNEKPFGFYLHAGNDTFIEVFEGDPDAVGNIKHVAIQVENLDELIERIRSNGYEVSDKALGADNSWQAWVTDPSGVRIEFHEYTPKSLQITGGVCQL